MDAQGKMSESRTLLSLVLTPSSPLTNLIDATSKIYLIFSSVFQILQDPHPDFYHLPPHLLHPPQGLVQITSSSCPDHLNITSN